MIAVQGHGERCRRVIWGAGGYLEMNVYKPLMIANITQSITLLSRRLHEFSASS